jgi:hypothetical protein
MWSMDFLLPFGATNCHQVRSDRYRFGKGCFNACVQNGGRPFEAWLMLRSQAGKAKKVT